MLSSVWSACDEAALKTARKLVKEEVLYLHFEEAEGPFNILECEHTRSDNNKSEYKLSVEIGDKHCDFTFSVASIGGTFLVKNQANIKEQNSQCRTVVKDVQNFEEFSDVHESVQHEVHVYEQERPKEEQIMLGGQNPCSEHDKATYLAEALTALKRPSLFGANDVIKCTVQVIYGLDVNIEFGNSERICKVSMYYDPEKSQPDVNLLKEDCFSSSQETERQTSKPAEQMMVGGFSSCNEEQKKRYLGDALGFFGLHAGQFTIYDITSCDKQVVAGVNVKLSFGSDSNKACSLRMFYPLDKQAPQVTVESDACVPQEKESILEIPKPTMMVGGWTPCSEEQKAEYLSAVLEDVNRVGAFSASDVTSCKKQLVAGLKVDLEFGSSSKCHVKLFYPLGISKPELKIEKDDCIAQQEETITLPTLVRQHEKIPELGGRNPCSEDQKNKYLSMVLDHLNRPNLFGTEQVTKCTKQVVYGWSVMIEFGNDSGHLCSAHIQIPPSKQDIQINMQSSSCLPSENLKIQVDEKPQIAGGFGNCHPEQKSSYLKDALSYLHIVGAYTENDVVTCNQQVVAGLNVEISFGSELLSLCVIKLFYPLGNQKPEVNIVSGDCIHPEKPTQHLDGGYQPCPEDNKREYLSALLTKLNKKGLFHSSQVIACEQQVVAGMNIKLVFGHSSQESCVAKLFYPLYSEVPEVEMQNESCFSTQSERLKDVSFEPLPLGGKQNCSEENKLRFLHDALTKFNRVGLFSVNNIISCYSQIVAGENVDLVFGSNKDQACVVHMFYALYSETPQIEIKKDSCIPEETLIGEHAQKLGKDSFIPYLEERQKFHNVGAWQSCNENDVPSYTQDALTFLKATDLYSAADVINCVSQVVAGLNIKLTIGVNNQNTCELELYYAPGSDKPEVTPDINRCISDEAIELVKQRKEQKEAMDRKYLQEPQLNNEAIQLANAQKRQREAIERNFLNLVKPETTIQEPANVESKEEPKEEQIMGGFTGKCDGELKQKYLSAVLADIQEQGLFAVNDVLSCSTQVVNGINVRLSFGSDESHACHAELYYPLGSDIEPAVFMKSKDCLKSHKLIGEPSESKQCSAINENKAIKAAKATIAATTQRRHIFEQNVKGCTEQFADGTKIQLTLSFNGHKCQFSCFINPATNQVEHEKSDC